MPTLGWCTMAYTLGIAKGVGKLTRQLKEYGVSHACGIRIRDSNFWDGKTGGEKHQPVPRRKMTRRDGFSYLYRQLVTYKRWVLPTTRGSFFPGRWCWKAGDPVSFGAAMDPIGRVSLWWDSDALAKILRKVEAVTRRRREKREGERLSCGMNCRVVLQGRGLQL